VVALVEDIDQRGQLNNTLLVISGEFGRTPKINGGGRDLWAHLSALTFRWRRFEDGASRRRIHREG